MDKDENKVKFNVPIHVMDLPSVPTDVKREIGFGIFIGDTKLGIMFHELTIEKDAVTKGAPEALTIKKAKTQKLYTCFVQAFSVRLLKTKGEKLIIKVFSR